MERITPNRAALPACPAVVLAMVMTAAAEAPLPWLEDVAKPLAEAAAIEEVAAAAAGRRLVLLGESTHGTHEYYVWRDRISRRLIESGRFRFIAVEGDWAAMHALNRYVKHLPDAPASAREALAGITRWPVWMWANEETAALGEWLREWNADRPAEERAGIYGMDVYAPWESAGLLQAVAASHLPDAGDRIERKLAPFLAARDDPGAYVRAHIADPDAPVEGYAGLLALIRGSRGTNGLADADWFAAKQSVHVVKGAHRHFMGMARRGPDSWNERATHMHATVLRLLEHYGPEAGGIVWAHNTHIGDARATGMTVRGEVNIGQLSRTALGEDQVFAVGFSTDRGTVQAGRAWEAPREVMRIPAGAPGSLESLLNHRFPEGAFFRLDAAPAAAANQSIGHRAIGVVYRPEAEAGNYVRTRPAARYDALVFIPETKALSPLAD